MSSHVLMMETPPRDERRVVTLHPALEGRRATSIVGMVIFLASWAMMFMALFFSFWLFRARQPVWPPVGFQPLPLLLPSINTGLIFLSSLTLAAGMQALRRQRLGRFAALAWITIALGAVFLALQLRVWTGLWETGLRLDSGPYGGYFYFLTVFHGLHVVVGLGLLCWLALAARRPELAIRRETRLKLAGLFWHFVDGVWLLMFLFVYLV